MEKEAIRAREKVALAADDVPMFFGDGALVGAGSFLRSVGELGAGGRDIEEEEEEEDASESATVDEDAAEAWAEEPVSRAGAVWTVAVSVEAAVAVVTGRGWMKEVISIEAGSSVLSGTAVVFWSAGCGGSRGVVAKTSLAVEKSEAPFRLRKDRSLRARWY
jgi:hypothetical protein